LFLASGLFHIFIFVSIHKSRVSLKFLLAQSLEQ
jgi:hypothetical protein